MVKQFVLVYLDILELLLHVDQNASLALNVLKTRHVTIKNALIHVLEHVESMPIVKLETTTQFVHVLPDILVILSSDVKLKLFNRLHHQTLVNHPPVDQMLNVESMEIKPLVHVYLQ